MTEPKVLFLAGIMIKDSSYDCTRWRSDVSKYINSYIDGLTVTSMSKLYNENDFGVDGKETLRFNMTGIRDSDIVLVNMKDLEHSLSTSDEIFYAYISRKPIYGFSEEDIVHIHPWKEEQINKIFYGKNSLREAINYIAAHYT